MHELSIAHGLVEIASAAAQDADASRVTVVHLRLGALSGVVAEALHFGWDVATQGTLLEDACLEIEQVPVVAYCPHCASEVTIAEIQRLHCPHCDSPTPRIVRGKEIELTSLEIVDDTTNS
jgi:hydrogenase nickel incorporation protein HypA/HybF